MCPARATRPAQFLLWSARLWAAGVPVRSRRDTWRNRPARIRGRRQAEPESSEGRRRLSPTKVQAPFLRTPSQRREMLKLPTSLSGSPGDRSRAHKRAPPGPRAGGDCRTPPAACWDLRRGGAGEALGPQAEAPGCPTCAGGGSPHTPPAPLVLRPEPSHPPSSHCRDPSVLSPCLLDCSMGGEKMEALKSGIS